MWNRAECFVQVRGNLHMVSEIVSECIDYGIVTQLQLHVVLDRIHSRYLAPKRSLLQIMRTAGHRSGQFRCSTLKFPPSWFAPVDNSLQETAQSVSATGRMRSVKVAMAFADQFYQQRIQGLKKCM
jgi:hypothetical protein